MKTLKIKESKQTWQIYVIFKILTSFVASLYNESLSEKGRMDAHSFLMKQDEKALTVASLAYLSTSFSNHSHGWDFSSAVALN